MAITLKAEKREILGKKVKNLRKEGIVPAELFGPGINNIHLSIPKQKFIEIYKKAGKDTIIEIDIEGEKKSISTLISNVQIHPITRNPLNIDFYVVSRDTKIETEVSLEFKGVAPAEKEGLIIVKVLKEIKIKALPQNIPHEIEVDISCLKTIEDRIYVKDLKIPGDVEVITPSDMAVATISKKEEEVVEEKEEVETAPPAEGIKETAKKKEETTGTEEKKEVKSE